ncbi:hypothetical protein PAHAL_5G456900 [Panicum hallii]|uniref:SIAH-type domain-containing protein n=1 Tax=Panicum hallii TaxID=206008 RepID=A0A2T8INK7_9POAL|nr:hypothetical protein PAHAL_5G456900 [Panicum hallii]
MRSGAAATSVTLELDVLDCTVCWLPLCRPCAVGHLIRSSCLAKLPNRKKCHTCSRKGYYNRCYSMEKVLGSMQVPCSNARYGCTVKTSYHQKQDHEATCPHELCFCPGSGCDFSGRSPATLLRHFTDHGWPSTEFSYGASFRVAAQEEVRVLVGDDDHLFLLAVEPSEPSGCVLVSVVSVRPRDAKPEFRCSMYLGSWKNRSRTESKFQVPSTTFSGGMGTPQDCVMFSVPKFYLEKDSKISVIRSADLINWELGCHSMFLFPFWMLIGVSKCHLV